ncbi:MAG TPA: protein-disulfide reductase DsbD N-terminal domain-containing protein, partial [Verrucomicrobiae bacterium]|nr:protein-disulfide reductase DsbD N-terminal domain-containing protein [Verrucomicrobiae bacterium]
MLFNSIRTGDKPGRALSLCAAGMLFLTSSRAQAQEELVEDPFQPTVSVAAGGTGPGSLAVQFTVPAGHHLYRDRLEFARDGQLLETALPPGKEMKDRTTGQLREAYETNVVVTLPWTAIDTAATLTIDYQGCNEEACFFPQSRRFKITRDGSFALGEAGSPADTGVQPNGDKLLAGFEISRRASGFMNAEAMVDFL